MLVHLATGQALAEVVLSYLFEAFLLLEGRLAQKIVTIIHPCRLGVSDGLIMALYVRPQNLHIL